MSSVSAGGAQTGGSYYFSLSVASRWQQLDPQSAVSPNEQSRQKMFLQVRQKSYFLYYLQESPG